MCGICGRVNQDAQEPVTGPVLAAMVGQLAHRGPDDQGVWSQGQVGLGSTRLAVIDLSPNGHQPMCNEDGTVWITYNGEVYNHAELRQDLERRGHRYRSRTDTETIIHLYEEYGRDCAARLRGMFAFAIWDAGKKLLLLARDRFGKKPLVYASTLQGLAFASELRSLAQDPQVELDIDDTALLFYLTYGYIPAPLTVFRQARKLPPASTLTWQDGQVSVESYAQLHFAPKLSIGEEEAAEETLRLLQEATRLRLMSDVPLGAFLSGGIDSSAVVALMAEAASGPVKTFAIGFDDPSYDELPYARQVAGRFGTDHHEFRVTPDAAADLPDLVWAFGEPFADPSALPTYLVARLTRPHVTVALNGDGGDEAFAGYERYAANLLAGRLSRLPAWLRGGLSRAASRLPENTERRSTLRRVKRLLGISAGVGDSPVRRYAGWSTLFSGDELTDLLSLSFWQRVQAPDPLALYEQAFAAAGSSDLLDQMQFTDYLTYLPGDLLVKMDIATMANSLEARSPFLDPALVEFAARLPVSFRLHGRQSKYILKRALAGRLPAEILNREKAGFALPLGRWFRESLGAAAGQVLLSPQALQRDLLDPQAVRKLLDEHTAGVRNHGRQLWQLLWLELWFRTFQDRSRREWTGPAAGILG